ncbi:cobalamin biosynthesis protein [Nocardia sp. NPDC088792]|uniref:cobalamin biosynthesis protein n=1 Tax=Nocardia sp. NPDC088792 TaxID=3364332 RepID=UPI00380CCD5E
MPPTPDAAAPVATGCHHGPSAGCLRDVAPRDTATGARVGAGAAKDAALAAASWASPPAVAPQVPRLAVGVGARPGVPADAIVAAVREGMGEAVIHCLATVDRRAAEPGPAAAAAMLGVPLLVFSADELAAVPVPTPSPRTATAVGTASVAEAAALLAAGSTELAVHKRVLHGITVAAAAIRR